MNPVEGKTEHLWLKSINDGNQNSYKMALALSIIEVISDLDKTDSGYYRVPLSSILEQCARYYWDHTVIFKLRQTTNVKQKPVFVQLVQQYEKENPVCEGKRWNKLSGEEKKFIIDLFIKRKATLKNPLSRFQIDSGAPKSAGGDPEGEGWLYRWNIGKNEIQINKQRVADIKLNIPLYRSLAVYSWARFLEAYNNLPKLLMKTDLGKPSRKLSKFRTVMEQHDREFSYCICFYCAELISGSTHLDHVIPFSFLFGDALSNLVPSCASCNSSKRDKLPNDNTLLKLAERNNHVQSLDLDTDILYDLHKNGVYEALKQSRDNARTAGFQIWTDNAKK